jgi:signal transduction histidine kinase
MLPVIVAIARHDDQWLVWALYGAAALSLTAVVSPITNRILLPGKAKALATALGTLCGLLPLWLWPGITILVALTGHEANPAHDPAPSALWACLGLAPAAFVDLAVGSRIFGSHAEQLARLMLSITAGLAAIGLAWLALGPISPAVPYAAVAVAGLAVFIAVQQSAGALLARYMQAPSAAVETAIAEVTAHADEAGTAEQLAAGLAERLARVLHVQYVAITAAESLPSLPERTLATYGSSVPQAPEPSPDNRRSGSIPVSPSTEYVVSVPLRGDGDVAGALHLGVSSHDRWPEYDPGDLDRLGLTLGLAVRSRIAAAQAAERANSMMALARRLSQAHEQERANLSRELHDVVAQELIALTRHLRRYDAENLPPPAIWADMLAGAQDALVAIRRICNGLRPAILDLGLVPALRDLIASVAETSDADIALSVIGRERRFDGDLEFALFRVAQESLSNAVAHAGARVIRVEVEFAEAVVVRVRDDGRGFDVPERFEDLPGDHLGMIGMRERIAQHGGQLNVSSTKGRGTTIEAWISAKG